MKKKSKKEIESYARFILKPYGINVNVSYGGNESYSKFTKPGEAMINLSTNSIVDDRYQNDHFKNSEEMQKMRLKGILNHELGHILFTDFAPYSKIVEEEKLAHKDISNYTVDVKRELKAGNVQQSTADKMCSLIYKYIYYHNLVLLVNMLEDAAVEGLMPGLESVSETTRDRIYSEIAEMRNLSYYYGTKPSPVPTPTLKACLFETHHFGAIGYRLKTNPKTICKRYGEKTADELFDLAMYSKWNTQNTTERVAIARVIMKRFDDLIQEKAEEHLKMMLSALAMSEDDIETLCGIFPPFPPEASFSIPTSKKSPPMPNMHSEYEYDIADDELKKEVEDEIKQDQEKNDGDGESSSVNQNNESGSENSSQPNDDENLSQASHDNSSSSRNNAGNSSQENSSQSPSGKLPEGNKGEGDIPKGQEQSENNDSENPSQFSQNENGEKKDAQSAENTHVPGEEEHEQETEKKVLSRKNLNKLAEDLDEKHKNEVEKLLKSQQSAVEKQRDKDFQNCVNDSSKNGLGECPESAHANVHTKLHIVKDSDQKSCYGECAFAHQEEDKKIATQIAKEINTIKMYDKRASRKVSKKGNLNNAYLYRALTDQRCFKKVSPGRQKNMRIALVLDLSGSMWGPKLQNAIRTAYILAAACIRCRVPVSVWGHNASDTCNLYKFIDYGDKQVNKIYCADADNSNRDGLAFYHVAQNLVQNKKNHEQLILITLSDGSPAHSGYYGQAAKEDIKRILNSFKQFYQVHSIGICMEMTASEVESCQNIYGENVVVVENSNELAPKTIELLGNLLK